MRRTLTVILQCPVKFLETRTSINISQNIKTHKSLHINICFDAKILKQSRKKSDKRIYIYIVKGTLLSGRPYIIEIYIHLDMDISSCNSDFILFHWNGIVYLLFSIYIFLITVHWVIRYRSWKEIIYFSLCFVTNYTFKRRRIIMELNCKLVNRISYSWPQLKSQIEKRKKRERATRTERVESCTELLFPFSNPPDVHQLRNK